MTELRILGLISKLKEANGGFSDAFLDTIVSLIPELRSTSFSSPVIGEEFVVDKVKICFFAISRPLFS